MSESAIEKELCEVAAITIKKNEDRQKYLKRLMLKVTKLPDPDWEALSKESQDWTNGAAEAYKAGDELEDFPDYEEVDDNPPMDEEVNEEAVSVAAKTKANKKADKVEKEPDVRPATNTHPGRKVSACHTIKKMVVKEPKITVAELSERLKESGLKVSDVTIATLRSDLRDTLRVLNEVGVGSFTL